MKLQGLKFILINLILFYPFLGKRLIFSSTNPYKPTSEYLKKIPKNNFYILGPGDLINIEVNEDTPELNTNFSVDGEGTAKLKRLNKIYVSGLTIGELTEILNKEYQFFVKEPKVKLSVIKYRPVKVYVEGEVDNPGLHVLEGSSSPIQAIENFNFNNTESNNNISSSETQISNNTYFPSLFDVLRKSNGVSVYADLENIEITRINNLSNGGGRIKTNLNILETLTLKDVRQNIRIFDGDTVKIPRNNKPFTEQISIAMKSNINPKFINVAIAGRVENPGQLTLNKTATLNEAIIFSGGLKALKGPIVFLRYQNDGKIDRRKFRYSRYAKPGSYKNPFLNNGDFIAVSKGPLTKTSEVIAEITEPLQGIFTSYGFYKILTEN